VVLQVAYFVTDQALPSYTTPVYKRNQHSAKPQVSTELFTFTFIMDIYNAPTSFYTISSNQTDDQSFDSTVSALVI
jgi:hypothetical protein